MRGCICQCRVFFVWLYRSVGIICRIFELRFLFPFVDIDSPPKSPAIKTPAPPESLPYPPHCPLGGGAPLQRRGRGSRGSQMVYAQPDRDMSTPPACRGCLTQLPPTKLTAAKKNPLTRLTAAQIPKAKTATLIQHKENKKANHTKAKAS